MHSALPFEPREKSNEVLIFEVVPRGPMSEDRSALTVTPVEAEIRLFSATIIQTSLGQGSTPVVHSVAEWLMKGKKRAQWMCSLQRLVKALASIYGWGWQRSWRNATSVCREVAVRSEHSGLDAVRDLVSWIFVQQKSPFSQQAASDSARSNPPAGTSV